MRLLRRGKVKDIYDLDDGTLLFHFSDRVSAFDVQMLTPIPKKGEVLCRFAEFWFNALATPHHMIEVVEKDKMRVRKLAMMPIECVVRGYFYGSFVTRYKDFLGKALPSNFDPVLAGKLPSVIFDPTTKSEEHDVPISRENAISSKVATAEEYDYLERTSIPLYEKMNKIAANAGFILADVKFEFGKDNKGEIVLGDSLGPDEYRLWLTEQYAPGRIQESYDKQLLRDWLVRTGFKEKVDRFAKDRSKPPSPEIVPEVMAELSSRYLLAYERITGQKF